MNDHQSEVSKYERIWALPEYHQWSPGEHAVDTFLRHVHWEPGDTLVDLGCGTGRAGLRLEHRGFKVTLLDFTPRGIEIALPFLCCNLWNLPPHLRFDWIYCVDVLEHLPPSYIVAALQGMARMSVKGGYLQIALFDDHFGERIGERLHLTVRTADWWSIAIAEFWDFRLIADDRDIRGNPGYAKFILGESYVR